MERRLWLGVAIALGSVACSADAGGASNVMNQDPAMGTDGGATGGVSNGAAGANTGGPGGTNTGSGTTGGLDNTCEKRAVKADKIIPDMLIVLDKSGSMVWPGCTAANNPPQAGCSNGVSTTPPYQMPFDRWVPSVAALKTTTAALEERVRFGLMIFPSDPIPATLFPPKLAEGCQPGMVFEAPALRTAARIATALDSETADGDSTPIPGTLKAAHEALGSGLTGPDQAPKPKYVLLVTDGAPTCRVDNRPALTAEEANMDTYAEIDSLTQDGIKTYVIGYDTRSTADLAVVLDEMARRGGTGATAHQEVTDENSLLDAITAIAGDITTCTYKLDMPVPDVKKVSVILDGKPQKNGENGWVLGMDMKTIELRGKACDTLQDAEVVHGLDITVECRDVVVQ